MNSYSLLTSIPAADSGTSPWGGIIGPVVNVRDKGAKGDGRTDDTAAIQSAVDALPATGGTVYVPRGDYRIDVTKAVVLKSNMLFLMDSAATLAAIPTDAGRYWVIKVWEADNVRIVGGHVVGELVGHKGTTGEQGYGINIQASSNVVVSDVQISNCWGDGMWIGAIGADGNAVPATNITVDRVTSSRNRRQGLSIGPAENVLVLNSTFSHTEGTNPQAGVDIEPQRQGFTRNITFRHCTMTHNRGCGMEIHGNTVGLLIEDCVINDNFGYGVMTKEEANMEETKPTAITFSDNAITRNGLEGIMIGGSSERVHIARNAVVGNGFRFPLPPGGDDPNQHWATSIGTDAKEDEELSVGPDLTIRATANFVTVSGNTFTSR